jgi:hypothetical protein
MCDVPVHDSCAIHFNAPSVLEFDRNDSSLMILGPNPGGRLARRHVASVSLLLTH